MAMSRWNEQITAVNEVRHEPLITWEQDETVGSVALRILRHLAHSVTKTVYPDRGRVRRIDHLRQSAHMAAPLGRFRLHGVTVSVVCNLALQTPRLRSPVSAA